jgi:hypothetical protein
MFLLGADTMFKQFNLWGYSEPVLSRKCPSCGASLGRFIRKEKFFKTNGEEIKIHDIKSVLNPFDFSALSLVLNRSIVCECPQCKCRWPLYKNRDEYVPTTFSSQKDPGQGLNYRVQLISDVEKTQATTEEVRVPSGVTIKVQRSRTVEHTITIEWRALGGIEIDAGLEQVLSVSIRGEIERTEGRTYQQSETRGYEIDLSGDKSNQYRLIWTDVWRKGLVEIQNGNETAVLPFRFRERTELEVIAINA